MRFVVKSSHFVVCPQCRFRFLSSKGVFDCKTITCSTCGVEVLR